MQLLEFSPETVPATTRTAAPKIGFQKTGLITINQEAIELLKLKEGETVKLFQDEENQEDWFIAKAANGFELRSISSGSNKKMMGFSCAYLKNKVFESLQYDKPSCTVPIKDEPIKITNLKATAYLILTAARKK